MDETNLPVRLVEVGGRKDGKRYQVIDNKGKKVKAFDTLTAAEEFILRLNVTMKPKFTAKWIKANGECISVYPKNGKDFNLEEMQKFVGGYIQIIRPPSETGAILVCNDEGKLQGLPINVAATTMWQEFADITSERMSDPVVGDVLLCHRSQIK